MQFGKSFDPIPSKITSESQQELYKAEHLRVELCRYYADLALENRILQWAMWFQNNDKDPRDYDFVEYQNYDDMDFKVKTFLGWQRRILPKR